MADAQAGETFLRVQKARAAAPGCQNVIAMCRFDLSTNEYSEKYQVFRTDRWGEKLTELETHFNWMTRAKKI